MMQETNYKKKRFLTFLFIFLYYEKQNDHEK